MKTVDGWSNEPKRVELDATSLDLTLILDELFPSLLVLRCFAWSIGTTLLLLPTLTYLRPTLTVLRERLDGVLSFSPEPSRGPYPIQP